MDFDRRLKGLSHLPWLCIGDFNEIMHPNEKSGGNDRNVSMISEFREVVMNVTLLTWGIRGIPIHGPTDNSDLTILKRGWIELYVARI